MQRDISFLWKGWNGLSFFHQLEWFWVKHPLSGRVMPSLSGRFLSFESVRSLKPIFDFSELITINAFLISLYLSIWPLEPSLNTYFNLKIFRRETNSPTFFKHLLDKSWHFLRISGWFTSFRHSHTMPSWWSFATWQQKYIPKPSWILGMP